MLLVIPKVINRIKKSCGDINEVELAKLGVALLNCQSKSEGRKTYECTDEMVSLFSDNCIFCTQNFNLVIHSGDHYGKQGTSSRFTKSDY